jgi:UDP-N-acetylenolpyruvoylglucosamine reductase
MSTKYTPNSKGLLSLKRELTARFGDRFRENEPLAPYVSAGVGGVTEFAVIAESSEELSESAKLSIIHGVEFRVVGGGTGTLPSEVGFPGLVIVNRTDNIAFDQGASVVIAASGLSNQALLTSAATRGFGGIEFISGVPGTVGGAVATNASYDGQQIGDYIKDVTIFVGDKDESRVVTVPAAQLGLKPLSSLILAEKRFPPLILSVRLQLARLPQDEILRRLAKYRTRSQLVHSSRSQLGTFLNPPLEAQRDLYREWRRLRLNPHLRLRIEEGTLIGSPPRTTASDLRRAVDALRSTADNAGVRLEDRVTYLGYWPAMEEENVT